DAQLAPEERSRLLNRTRALQRETERLRGILSDFLEFAGQIHLERRETDVGAMVRELVDFFLPEAERHGVALRAEAAMPGVLRAEIDPRLVKQALLNLMINATQAFGPGATAQGDGAAGVREVVLRVAQGREPDGTRVVCIHVIDTGPGIPQETLGSIFKPYFTTKSGGSGLGLPTSRRLIEEHGGRIAVRSEVGRGSEFTVVLPVTPPAAKGTPGPAV
ncbi:MAG: hypothetical protein K2Q20_05445, partial [Phycisphaerales bacterium]|nr:hypothetical protein [Phycisphaerales bacterium]